MKFKISIFLILLSSSLNAQTIKLSGKITNQKTGKALPFVNIQVRNSRYGTVSDNKGNFNLKVPSKYTNYYVIFSYMGYESQNRILNKTNNSCKISLNPTDKQLDEVVIMPDSTLLNLLRAAFKNIPENYSTKPTKLKGFYREYLKTENNQYLHFAEAVTETYKTTYKKSSDDGQVKILKSIVNVFPRADTLNNVAFYGGIFAYNEGDFVKQREDFINPRHFNRYNYTLEGITNYQNSEVYIINFDTKNDSLKGTSKGKLYIEKSSLAYIACKYKDTKRGIRKYNNQNISTTFEFITSETFVNYMKYKDKWHIKYIIDKCTGINKKFNGNLVIGGEYIVTKIYTDTVRPIPYEERIEYTDIFSHIASNYDSKTYWSEYNVLEQDSFLKNQIKTLYNTEQSKKMLTMKTATPKGNILLKTFEKITTGLGISYFPVNTDAGEYSVYSENGNEIINFTENLNSFNYNLCFNMQINYSLNTRWGIDFAIYKSLEKKMFLKSYNIGVSYKLLLLKKRKPLILKTSFSYSYNNFSRNFSKAENNSNLAFGNKDFNSKEIQFSIGQRKIMLSPKICLQFKISKLLWLYSSFGYYINLKTTDKLYLREKSGFFLTRKKSSLNLTDNLLDVRFNGVRTLKSHINFKNYSFSLGFFLKL